MASELSVNDILQSKIFVRQLGIHALVLTQFALHLFHAFQVGCLHAAILGFPIVVSRITDTVTTANVLHFGAGIGFFSSESPDSYPAGNLQLLPVHFFGGAYEIMSIYDIGIQYEPHLGNHTDKYH